MFNNSSHVDASHSTFSEVHRDQYYNARSAVQGNQTINTIVHGNQIVQDAQSSNFIEILQKASAPSAAHDSAQRYPAPKCTQGTRVELLARLASWMDEPGQKPICWLNGRPGSGKSAVSQTMAETYASEKRLAASFFFSRRDLERRTTQYVVPTLTTQLLAFLPSIRPAVVAAMENDYMIPMKVLREQMEKLLLEPLSTAVETPDASFLIVVDALDECDDESLVSELVALLALLPRRTPLPLRLLITSRSEPLLQSQFHQPEISALTLSLEIHAFSAEADIRSFLSRALDDAYDQHLQVMKDIPRPWPSPVELERIVNKAGGLFIFALTVVKFVGDKMHNPVERLQAILEDNAPASAGAAYADLDSLYRDAISVFPDPDVTRLLLGIVYCMATPLSIPALHKLLQRPDVDARIIIPALSSVLLASEDGKQPIQFYHASFRDFLVSPQRSKKFAINPDAYHRLMAQLCFEIMSNALRRDMCAIGDPAKANNEIPDLAERRQAAFDEALSYACRFWSRHLAQLPGDGVANEVLSGAMRRFSTTVLLCWLEALSIFGELERAVVMLREGISWLKTLREVPEDTITLFQHAERLVVLYAEPISQCALHVYLTAISFVPADSPIHRTFKHQSFGTLILRPSVLEHVSSIIRKGINLHNPVHSVVFSPHGNLIATAGTKQGVQVWNAITGGNVASLGDHASTSLLVRFSPSGTFLAAAFEGGTVVVWDPKVGREHLKHEHCHTEQITCIEFSMNNTLLASGSRDRAIQVWSVETAQPLHRLATHEGPVTTLAFSSDSLRLVSGSEDNLLIVWDMSTGKVVRGMMGHRKMVNCVAVSGDGKIVASGSEDKTVRIWDVSSGKCTQKFSKGHYTGIRSVCFFGDDKRVIAVCDGAIISWDVASKNTSETIWSLEQFIRTVMQRFPTWQTKAIGWGTPRSLLKVALNSTLEETASEHNIIAYASQSPSVVFTHRGYIFSGSLPTPINYPPLKSTTAATAISISPDGLWAAIANPIGLVEILDLTVRGSTWEELETTAKLDSLDRINAAVPSPNGKRFILHSIRHWYLTDADFHIIKEISMGMMGPVRDDDDIRFKFSSDGSIVFCVVSGLFNDDKSTMRVFDSMTGEQRAQFSGLKRVHSFIASADGAWITCGHGSGKVEVFEVSGGRKTSMHVPDDSPVHALDFSEGAQELVGGSKSGVIRVWDRASGECKATFAASASMVTALAYAGTHGEARIAIGREDGSVCLWSPSASTSHDVVCNDQAKPKKVDAVRFSSDRSKLTTRAEDGSVSVWAVQFDADDANMSRCALCAKREDESDSHATSHPPHLLSRTDPEDTVDGYFRTAYRVRKDGWLVEGERRVVWLPPFVRPHGSDSFYAFEDGLVVILSPASKWFFLKYVE